MTGDHALQVRFSGMCLSNDVGQETYKGPPEVTPDLPALRRAVMYDATEGIVGWYIGYDGPGCVDLVRTATTSSSGSTTPERRVRVDSDHPDSLICLALSQ